MQAKCEMTKGTIQLGETPVTYQTAAMQQFAPYEQRQIKIEPKYKNYNQSLDVITAQVKDANEKKYGFDRFTE